MEVSTKSSDDRMSPALREHNRGSHVKCLEVRHGSEIWEEVRLSNAPGSSAQFSLQGAQLLSWQQQGRELFYLSPTTTFSAQGDNGTPVRGGIPIVAPWFGAGDTAHAPGEPALTVKPDNRAHGYARVSKWNLKETSWDGQTAGALLELANCPVGAERFCDLQMNVKLGESLTSELTVINRSAKQIVIEVLLHTYLAAADTASAKLIGLKGRPRLDRLGIGASSADLEHNDPLQITKHTDCLYQDVTAPLTLRDLQPGSTLIISGHGLSDIVVWNPFKERQFKDLPEADHLKFLCVELGRIRRPVVVDGYGSWSGSQTLSYQP